MIRSFKKSLKLYQLYVAQTEFQMWVLKSCFYINVCYHFWKLNPETQYDNLHTLQN